MYLHAKSEYGNEIRIMHRSEFEYENEIIHVPDRKRCKK